MSDIISISRMLVALLIGCADVCAQIQIPAQPLQPAGPVPFGQPPGAPLLPGDPNGPPSFPEDDLRLADPTATYGRFPVTIAGGRVVARCEVSTRHRRLPVNLFIDIESPCGLQLHNNVAQPLKAEDEVGRTIPITIHFPEFAVTVERREAGPEREFGEFTRLYSKEIGDDAVVGALGAKFFKDYALTLDLKLGYVHIAPAGASQDKDQQQQEQLQEDEGTIRVALTTTDDVAWLPVQRPDGKIAAMAIASSQKDTLIDAEWCDAEGFPAGNVNPLMIGDVNVAEFVAFRPSEITYVHPDQALGVIGLNLLKHLRIELNQARTTARIEVSVPAAYPKADLAFFEAMIEDDSDAFEAYLEEYPTEELSQEAARLLLDLRIDEAAEPGDFERAITWLHATWREDIRTTRALDLMKELREAGLAEQGLIVGDLGIGSGRKDRYPDAVHKLHADMGEVQLEQGEDKAAWRHLLSAAFGMPENGRINLRLGECYERQGRLQRAMSRYVQAVIDVESGEQAVAGLERVSKSLGDNQQLSVERIAPLIEGKTYGYSAATRYRPEGEPNNRVALIEFFTNAHIKHPSRDEGAIGGALANEGVMTYFPRNKVAMLSYHLPHPRLEVDSLTNELAQAQADYYSAPPAVQLVNGQHQFPGAGKAREAEKLYKMGREKVLEGLAVPSDLSLTLNSIVEGHEIKGQLEIAGPQIADARVHIVLAEKAVLYPGRSKVIIHHMVARAALTDTVLGQPYRSDDGKMVIDFSASVKRIEQGNRIYLEQLQSEGRGAVQTFAAKIDPRQLTVIAFIRDNESREVLQAVQVDPKIGEQAS